MPSCSVPYCPNTTGKDSNLTFHEFPHETPLFLNKWLENIGRPNWRPGLRSVICNEHFEKDDFDKQKRLRIGSFPSKFPESPFRKKKKHDTDHRVSTSPGISSQGGTVSAVKRPSETQAIHSGFSLPASKEDGVMILSQNVRVNASKSGTTVLKPTRSLEVPKKRRILEESHPSPLNADNVASVASSFSLLSCRVCGQTNGNHVNIFGDEGLKEDLQGMINKCLPMKISQSDSLPLSVCKLCIARLKLCCELIDSSERTNNSFKGATKEADPPIIHSKPLHLSNNDEGNRRVLLLEMSLKEGAPVKGMIAHAVQELQLRLQPKGSRESKPEGRIMFLDLQGPSEAYPEQMKKAISMLFPSPLNPVPPLEKRVDLKSVQNQTILLPKQKLVPNLLSNNVTRRSMAPEISVQNKLLTTTTSSSNKPSQDVFANAVPSVSATVVQPNSQVPQASSSRSATTMPTLVMKTMLPQGTSPTNSGKKIIAQTPSPLPGLPVAIFPKTSGTGTPIRVAALPSSLPSGAMPKIIHLPTTSNFINIQPKPNVSVASATSVSCSLTDTADADQNVEDHSEIEPDGICRPTELSLPPLVPIGGSLASKESPMEIMKKGTPVIDLAQMKDKVITKLNNMGNQFKLGDKIVGIVLRNCDNKEEIQRKLQATFARAVPLKDSRKTIEKSSDSPSLLEGSLITPVTKTSGSTPDVGNGIKKLRDRPMDVPSTVNDPSIYFDRRNARKLSLSFMWRRTGFLVSSYQKLFTWQMPAANDDPTSAYPILKCRVCKFEASSKGEVETHLQAHPDLQCSVCWKYFLTVGKVHEHMSVIHCLSTPSEIPKRKTFVTWRLNNLRRNPLRHYQCSRCDRRFKVKDALKRHAGVCKERTGFEKIIAINQGLLVVCSTCNRTFSSDRALKDHMLGHMKRTSWLCDVCGLVLKSASNYRTHIARHDEHAHEYTYQCSVCKKRFKLKHRFEDHVKKHDVEKQFICASCGKVFRTLNGLRQHEILHGERKLQCSYCPSRFHRRDHLRIHEGSHTNTGKYRRRSNRDSGSPNAPRMFTCRFCVATDSTVVKFASMRELLRHYTDVHPNERVGNIPGAKRFVCDRCNKAFANSTLLKHHHMWHAGLYPYSCSHCGQGFMVKERLRNHEWSHTNERPFKCQTCGKGFRSRNCLKQHKVIHNDPSKFFKCKFCDKTFSRIDNLRTHTRVHTGEKPWKCNHCDRQFRLRSECTKHIQIAHNIPPVEALEHMETSFDLNNPGHVEEDGSASSNSADSAIAVAIAGISTVQDMELLIEDDDMGEIEETEVM